MRRRWGVRSTQIFPTWRQSQFISRRFVAKYALDVIDRDGIATRSFAFSAFPKSPKRERQSGTAYWSLVVVRTLDDYFLVAEFNFLLSVFFFSPALRLPEPYKSDTTDGRWKSALHVRHERARAQGLGDLCKFLLFLIEKLEYTFL